MIKYGGKSMGKLIHALFNMIWMTGIVPEKIQRAIIVILHKKGAKTDIANYRPITLASALLKTYEKVLYNRIMHHMHRTPAKGKKPRIHEAQGMCKPGQGSIDAVAKLIQRISGLSKWALVSYDLAKAFDRVIRDALYVKLRRKGIKGRLLQAAIMATYSKSSIRVKIGAETSGDASFANGIKQGSVLSPILFVIFVDDLLDDLEIMGDNNQIINSGKMFMDDLATVNGSAEDIAKSHES
jgi:hypothetical protein